MQHSTGRDIVALEDLVPTPDDGFESSSYHPVVTDPETTA